MFKFLKTRFSFDLVFLSVTLSVLLSGCTTGSIVSNSAISSKISNKMTSVLFVNTNFPEKDTTVEQVSKSLMLEQFGISINLQKKLADAGIKGSTLYIKKMELDPATILEQAISTKNPTHLLQVTVPNGTFRNNSPMAEKYSVQVVLTDAKTKTVVWKYLADVNQGREARSEHVVAAIIINMQKDGIF